MNLLKQKSWAVVIIDENEDSKEIKIINLLKENKTIMAHCVLVNEGEIDLLRDRKVFIAHCPTSNLNLSSGIAPIRRLIERKVNVGLASDISGGHTLSIPEVITSSAQVSNLRWLNSNKVEEKLTTAELFYLATKGGGGILW